MTPLKVKGFTLTDTSESEIDQVPYKEFKRMIIRMAVNSSSSTVPA
jgi:hypothetical protein